MRFARCDVRAELAVGNVVRRVLHMIREEAKRVEQAEHSVEDKPSKAGAAAAAHAQKQLVSPSQAPWTRNSP